MLQLPAIKRSFQEVVVPRCVYSLWKYSREVHLGVPEYDRGER
jgi:hypothetical protein